MAWDRRLLSRYQHLVLLISGFHGLYPVLNTDGTYTPAASQLQANLTFKVGLSGRYKPGKEQAQEIVRKHGLIQNDAEDELRILEEKLAQEKAMADFWDSDAEEAPTEEEEPPKEEEPEDPGRFERFSLTSSLESLFQQSFLQLVQLRRRFSIGWAGAELLLNVMEKLQVPANTVYEARKEVGLLRSFAAKVFIAIVCWQDIQVADKHEIDLARSSVKLPDDPMSRLEEDQAINLPLTAFSYLIRRLTVRGANSQPLLVLTRDRRLAVHKVLRCLSQRASDRL
jgi:ubiquitin-conjugating enzyme E2 Q